MPFTVLTPEALQRQLQMEEQLEKERRKNTPRTREDDVADLVRRHILQEGEEFDEDLLECSNYADYKTYVLEEMLGLPEWARQWFDVEAMTLYNWLYSSSKGEGEFYIIYDDEDDGLAMLEYAGDVCGLMSEFANRFYVVRYRS